MPRHTKDLIALTPIEAVTNALIMFDHDQYLEWVIVYAHWEDRKSDKMLISRAELAEWWMPKQSLKDVQAILDRREQQYNDYKRTGYPDSFLG